MRVRAGQIDEMRRGLIRVYIEALQQLANTAQHHLLKKKDAMAELEVNRPRLTELNRLITQIGWNSTPPTRRPSNSPATGNCSKTPPSAHYPKRATTSAKPASNSTTTRVRRSIRSLGLAACSTSPHTPPHQPPPCSARTRTTFRLTCQRGRREPADRHLEHRPTQPPHPKMGHQPR